MVARTSADDRHRLGLGSTKVKHERDVAEFREQLVVEIRHLRRSATYFDGGDESEAQRLAVTIRKLVHDHGGNSVSLLTHLGMKSNLRFIDTAPRLDPSWPPGTIMLHAGLVTMRATFGSGEGTRFVAPLDDLSPDRVHPPVEFDRWWTTTVVTDQQGNPFSRRAFVLGVANQDGGAHIDASPRTCVRGSDARWLARD